MRADGVPQAARPLGGLDADTAWYRTHKQALEGRYSGQYLVIMDQRVVDHAAEFGALAERALGRNLLNLFTATLRGPERWVEVNGSWISPGDIAAWSPPAADRRGPGGGGHPVVRDGDRCTHAGGLVTRIVNSNG